MAQSTFQHFAIKGISTVVPADETRLQDELQYFGGDAKKAARATKVVGIDRRRIAPHGVTAADLCQQAAENLLTGMGVDPVGIDALIFASQMADHFLPTTSLYFAAQVGPPKNMRRL